MTFVSSAVETPVFIAAGQDSLFGVVSGSPGDARGAGVIYLSAAGGDGTAGNRFSVHLCRRLEAEGYRTLRLDYHGTGESTGSVDQFRLSEPFTDDVEAAIRWMERQGVGQFALVGSCFGARTALAYAALRSNVKALVFIRADMRETTTYDPEFRAMRLAFRLSTAQYVRRALRLRVFRNLWRAEKRRTYVRAVKAKLERLLSRFRRRATSESSTEPDRWVGETFWGELQSVVRRRVPALFVYGTEDTAYADFLHARAGRLGDLLDRNAGLLEVRTFPGRVQSYPHDAQVFLLDAISGWLKEKGMAPAPNATAEDGGRP